MSNTYENFGNTFTFAEALAEASQSLAAATATASAQPVACVIALVIEGPNDTAKTQIVQIFDETRVQKRFSADARACLLHNLGNELLALAHEISPTTTAALRRPVGLPSRRPRTPRH
jgi:hypothetical protein